tara:strand:- start:723 stop:1259 length:537 start_codon:yes stop_codon:yes gene_type:complete
MDDIIVIDDFLDDSELNTVNGLLNPFHRDWGLQKSDEHSNENIFLVRDLINIPFFKEELLKKIAKTLDIEDNTPVQCYLNAQWPHRDGDPHQDSCDKTVIIYPFRSKPHWGGFTQFISPNNPEDQLVIPPLMGRLVCFPGHVLHKGYAYSNQNNPLRQSIVYKFGRRNYSNVLYPDFA